MAGERLTKITVQASLSPNDNERGNQTARVRLQLGGVWLDYYRGAYTQQRQFDVPDPDDVKRDYVKLAVDNLLALVKLDIQSRGLPYTVSVSRDLGNDVATGWPKVAFDIEATQYQPQLNLDFFSYYTGGNPGWAVLSKVSTLQPITLQAQVVPTGSYGSADGQLFVRAFQGNTTPFTYVWADDPTATSGSRQNLEAGKYIVTVSDQDGVSVTATYEITSDTQLLVTVQQTETDITLVVSGGVPPYAVAWDDGPTDLVRTGLSPGEYQATVSDARGASQRITVILLAGSCYFSQNPVRLALDAGDDYRADPTTKPNLSFVAEVWVELDYLSGAYVQAGPQLEQPADLLGRTVFDVQGVLDAYVHEHVPPLNAGLVTRVESVFKRFYLKSAERYGTPPLTAALSTAQVHVVLCGGLSPAEAEAGRWPAYQAAVQPFLTWEPDYQKVLPGQPAYLYYQHAAPDGDVQLHATVRRADGTMTDELLATLLGVRRWEVYSLAVGPTALGFTAADITGYDVWLATAAGVPRSQVRHFVLDRAYYPRQRFFVYSNSLGGANVLFAQGQAKQTLAVVATEAQRPAYDAELGDVATFDRLGTPTLSVVSGPRRRGQVQADQDLLYSRRVVLQKEGEYWQGRVAAGTFTVRDEAEGLASVAFDFVLAQQRHFSPRLPVVVLGLPIVPVAGGEGATP